MSEPQRYDVITIGSATEDVMIQANSAKVITIEDVDGERAYMAFEYGGKIHVDDILITVGGGSINTAITFAKQGMTVAPISEMGLDEPGDRVVARLESEGARTDLLVRSAENNTGYSTIITTFTGERTILVYRGASRELTKEDLPWDRMSNTEWMYVGALAGESSELYPLLGKFAAEHNIKVGLNLGTAHIDEGLEAFAGILRNTYVIFQNAEETHRLTGVPPDRGPEDEMEMFRRLHEVGVDIVVMTEGAKGAKASDGQAHYTVPAYQVEVTSTVGAGDAFAAGCMSALHRGLSLPESLRMAAANAASVVQQSGANVGILTWDEALAFVRERRAKGKGQVAKG